MTRVTTDDPVFEWARLKLWTLMRDAGMRQADLGPVIGLPQERVSDRLRGRSKLTLGEVRLAAQYFGVPVGEFFEPVEGVERFILVPASACVRIGAGQTTFLLAA